MTPTQRSIQYLKDNGMIVAKVEKWNSFVKIRQDLWGFDLAAVGNDGLLYFVQVTTGSHNAERTAKLKAMETTQRLSRNKNVKMFVHAWRRLKGEKKVTPIITEL